MPQRGQQHAPVAVVAASQTANVAHGAAAIELTPAGRGVDLEHIDRAGVLLHLAFQRDGPAPLQLANLAAEQVVVPPDGPRRVGVFTAPRDADQPRDQAPAAKQKEIAVANFAGDFREFYLAKHGVFSHERMKKARRRPTIGQRRAFADAVLSGPARYL